MNTQNGLQVLVQAVQLAQQKGAYSLAEAKLIAEAIEVFAVKPKAKPEEPVVEKASE